MRMLFSMLLIGSWFAPLSVEADESPFHPKMAHKPRLIHNEDSDGPTRDRKSSAGSVKADITKCFDELFTTTPTDVVIYSCAYADVVWLQHCPSGEKVYTRPGLGFEETTQVTPAAEQITEKRNLEELRSQDTDALDIVVERAAAHQKLVLAEMRMSDYHHGGVRPECYLCPKSVLDHPDWRLGPNIGLLNYAVPEVRALCLSVLRDIVTNYKVDGIELNWYRWGMHFPKGREREFAPLLSQWMLEVRQMLDEVAKAQGRPRLLLTHMVPATVDGAEALGCDVQTWIKQGTADIVMPSDFLNADFNLRTDQFVAAAKGTSTLIYPVVMPSMAGGVGLVTAENCAALSANYRKWGADGLTTFNMYQLGLPWDQRLYPLFASAEAAQACTRHYQFVRPTSGSRPVTFDKLNERYTFSFRVADTAVPPSGGVLRWRVYTTANPSRDGYSFDLNGVAISPEKTVVTWHPGGESVYRPGPVGGTRGESHPANFCYEINLTDCPPLQGDNELGARWIAKDDADDKERLLPVLEAIVQASKP